MVSAGTAGMAADCIAELVAAVVALSPEKRLAM
jgi:hypothetical protein